MERIIAIRELSFAYNGRSEHALKDIDLDIDRGDFVLISGPSGSGKSTLLRCINGIVPHFYGGSISGYVMVCGRDVLTTSTKELATSVGFVFQDPEDQLVSGDVESEIAFGLENLGVPPTEIGERISWMLDRVGITHLRGRSIDQLSGGEKQKVAIASVLALEPQVLILDEPFSQINHIDAQDIASLLARLNQEGLTIIVSEHRDDLVLPYARKRLYLSRGSLASGPSFDLRPGGPQGLDKPSPGTEPLVHFEAVSFAYGENQVLKNQNFRLFPNEFVALVGPNGSGKTTLAKHMNGLLKPQFGIVRVCGIDTSGSSVAELSRFVGYVPQNPNDLLFEDTVSEETLFYPKNLGADVDVDQILKEFGLLQYSQAYPRSLSGGERQRVALASIVSAMPRILVLDEPTRGLDRERKSRLIAFLNEYRRGGNAVLLITHDPRLAAAADRVVELG